MSSSSSSSSSSYDEAGDELIDVNHSTGITVAWRDLKYEVQDHMQEGKCNGRCSRKPKKMKTILNGVSACCPAGTMTAIMGPSGCGKSSLLDVLAGRIKQRFLSGTLTINGSPINFKSLKKDAAYVTQDDTLSGVLTVYAAMLKLPQHMSYSEKKDRINEVISDLGLVKVTDTKVGNWAYRGVSGGERRRVSIGVEIITKPTLFILDEPTSGLDALSAKMLIELLQSICKGSVKRTILLTIHQPSSYLFTLFDNFMLLSEGNQVWFGNHKAALRHFTAARLPLPNHVNPADAYMEAVNVNFDGSRPEDTGMPSLETLMDAWNKSTQKKNLITNVEKGEAKATGYVSSMPQYDGKCAKCCTHKHKYNTSFWWQTMILCKRFFWTWMRDPGVFWARLIMYSMIAFMMGTEYLRMPQDQDTIQDRNSILFFSVAFLVFMSVAAVPAFIEERHIFVRERGNAYYSVSPYALASSLVSLPFVFMIALTFTGISYFLMGLHESPEAFFYFLLDLFLALAVAEGIVTSISAVSPSYIVGIAVGAGLYGMFMINQGYFIRADNIPGWWIWVHYMVVHKYSFEGFMVNEFLGEDFACRIQNETTTDNGEVIKDCFCFYEDLNNDCQVNGIEVLMEYGYEDVNKWAWLGVMGAMAVIYRLIFYFFLLCFNKGKR